MTSASLEAIRERFAPVLGTTTDDPQLDERIGALADVILQREPASARLSSVDLLKDFRAQNATRA